LENYRAIGAVHRQVHLLAQELLTMAKKGHRASARTRLPELYAARDAFIARLAALVRDVQSTISAASR
jgi:hypothetical protein